MNQSNEILHCDYTVVGGNAQTILDSFIQIKKNVNWAPAPLSVVIIQILNRSNHNKKIIIRKANLCVASAMEPNTSSSL